jgi:hypothetical protein
VALEALQAASATALAELPQVWRAAVARFTVRGAGGTLHVRVAHQ